MERVQYLDEDLSMIQEDDHEIMHYQLSAKNECTNKNLSQGDEDFIHLKTTKFARFDEHQLIVSEMDNSFTQEYSGLDDSIQATIQKKLDFSIIDNSYKPAKNIDYLAIVQEDQSTKSKKAEKVTPSPAQFLEKLNEKMKQRLSVQEFDQENRKFPSVAQDAPNMHCRKQYDFNCQCKVCTHHLKKLKTKEVSKTIRMVKKEQKAFSNFVEYSLDSQGKIIKPQVVINTESENEQEGKIDYLRDIKKTKSNLMKPNPEFIFTQRGHNWLMENLLPPSDSICGCQVNIPDQVLVDKGKALFIMKTEKDGCINQVSRNKTHLMDVLRYFLTVSIDRKRMIQAEQMEQKETSQSIQLDIVSKNGTPFNKQTQGSVDELLFDQSMTDERSPKGRQKSVKSYGSGKNRQNNKSYNFNKPEKKRKQRNDDSNNLLPQLFYKECFIIRYDDDFVRILTESDYSTEINGNQYRANHPYWSTISCIQLTPQNKIGLGKRIKFTFSPMCIEKEISYKNSNKYHQNLNRKLQGEILFDYEQFGTDDQALEKSHVDAYCLKMCNKIGYYLQVIHKIDIIRMDVEFYQDECGTIQLYHTSNIWIRLLQNHKQLKKKEELNSQTQTVSQVKKENEVDQSIHKEAKLYKRYQFMQILKGVIDKLQLFSKEDQKEDLFEVMGDFQQKLNNYNSCDRIKIINENLIFKQKQFVKLSIKNQHSSKLTKQKIESGSPYLQNEEFFKFRNSSSAFEKIGNMGEIQSKLVNGDIMQYRTFLENKRAKTRGIFERKEIQKPKKDNMLDWMRKDQKNFLIPMVASRNSQIPTKPANTVEVYAPSHSDLNLVHNSNRPFELKENIVNMANQTQKSEQQFTQRVLNRWAFQQQQKDEQCENSNNITIREEKLSSPRKSIKRSQIQKKQLNSIQERIKKSQKNMRKFDAGKFKDLINVSKTEPDTSEQSGLGFEQIQNNQQMDQKQRGITEIKMMNKLKQNMFISAQSRQSVVLNKLQGLSSCHMSNRTFLKTKAEEEMYNTEQGDILTGISNFQDSKNEISQIKSEKFQSTFSLVVKPDIKIHVIRSSKTDEDLLRHLRITSSQDSQRATQKKVLNAEVPRNYGLIENKNSILSQSQYDQIAEEVKIYKQDKIFGPSLKKEYGYFKSKQNS